MGQFYYVGTMSVTGLAAGYYRQGSRFRVSVATRKSHQLVLRDDLDHDGSPVTIPVITYFGEDSFAAPGHADPRNFDNVTEAVDPFASENAARPYGVPGVDGAPDSFAAASIYTITAVDVSVAEYELPPVLSNAWNGGAGFHAPERLMWVDASTLRVKWEGNRFELSDFPYDWSHLNLARWTASDPNVVFSDLRYAAGPIVYTQYGQQWEDAAEKCFDVTVEGHPNGGGFDLGMPQFNLTTKGVWVRPPTTLLATGNSPAIDEPGVLNLEYANAFDGTHVDAVFSNPDGATEAITDPATYVFDNGLLALAAVGIADDPPTIRITTTQQIDTLYMLTMDTSSMPMDNNQASFQGIAVVVPFYISSVVALSATEVQIEFDVDIAADRAPETYLATSNFVIPGLDVSSATLTDHPRRVLVVTSAQTPGHAYTVTVGEMIGTDDEALEAASAGFAGFFQEEPAPPEPLTEPRLTPSVQRAPISDVRMFHTPDGGEISFVAGLLEMSDGLVEAVYLSLFGGNERDSGLPGDLSKQWWGNFSEPDPLKHYRSETQFLLDTLPPTTGNLRRIEAAVTNDLAWMVSSKLVRAVRPTVSMPARSSIHIAGVIEVDGNADGYRFAFPRTWGARAA